MEKVNLVEFKINSDNQGSLVAIENYNIFNLKIKRVFYIFNVKHGAVRGQHANRNSTMCFIGIRGSCKILINNGTEEEIFTLDSPAKGLICEPMTWKKLFDFTSDCVLMVLCDTNYDSGEYINNFDEFKLELKK